MKINLIPTKKLVLLSAALCATMLAFTNNASAVTVVGDAQELGNTFPPGVSNGAKAAAINHLIVQALGTTDRNIFLEGELFRSINRSNHNFGPLSNASVTGAVSGTGANLNIGSGIYSYLFASDGVKGVVYYIGNLSGDITIDFPGLVGWTLFGTGGQGVPDGGTTVMLLGTALGALGMARWFLKA